MKYGTSYFSPVQADKTLVELIYIKNLSDLEVIVRFHNSEVEVDCLKILYENFTGILMHYLYEDSTY